MSSRENLGQLRQKMAQNTIRALEVMAKKQKLEEIKNIIAQEVVSLRDSF